MFIQQLEAESDKGLPQFLQLLVGQTLGENFENFDLCRVERRVQDGFHLSCIFYKNTRFLRRMKFPILSILLIPQLLFAQPTVETDLKTGKYGLVNAYDGEIIMPFEYEYFYPLPADSIYVVKREGKFGAADARGNILIPCQYADLKFRKSAPNESYDFAVVHNDAAMPFKLGVVNRKGELVLPMRYAHVAVVAPGMLTARDFQDTLMQFFDARGQLLFAKKAIQAEPGFDGNSVKLTRAPYVHVFIRTTGELYFPVSPGAEQSRFPDLRWTDEQRIIHGKKGNVGMINLRGDTLLPFQYDDIAPTGDGNFWVSVPGFQTGLANGAGQFLVSPGRKSITKKRNIPESVYIVQGREQRLYDVVDRSGKTIATDCLAKFAETGDAAYPGDAKRWDYMTLKVESVGKTGFYHLDGRQILPQVYEFVYFFSENHPVLARRMDPSNPNKHKALAFDLQGKPLLPERFYDLRFTTNPKILIACESGTWLWGFVHMDRPEAFKPEFDGVNDLYNGYLAAKKGNRFQLFNSRLEELKIDPFTSVSQPVRTHFTQFRRQNLPGKLVAIGQRPDRPLIFAINERGQSFPLEPLPGQPAPPEVVEEVVEAAREPEVIELVEIVPHPKKKPEFPGGDKALFSYITSSLRYPALAREAKIQGTVIVSFMVEKDGRLSDIRITKDIGGGCGKEAERIVRAMPNWIPAEQDGQRVRTVYTLPVRFSLE